MKSTAREHKVYHVITRQMDIESLENLLSDMNCARRFAITLSFTLAFCSPVFALWPIREYQATRFRNYIIKIAVRRINYIGILVAVRDHSESLYLDLENAPQRGNEFISDKSSN